MTDFINMPPIPERLREPLRAVLRGDAALWPDVDAAEEAAFRTAAGEHAIGPLLYARLSAGETPPRIAESLRGVAMQAAAAEPMRLADLRALLAALAGSGVRPLLFKGTALAYSLYEVPEMRPRADTDLLIDRRDLVRARQSLVRAGYTARILSGDPHANRQQAFTRVDGFGVEHVYDVHWDIANTPVVRDAFGYEELMARAVALPRIAPDALAPSTVDALLLACIHRVAHHHDSDRLIWLCDIHLLRARMTAAEHAEFWRRAAERRVVAICERSIERADQWFARSPHDRAHDWLRDDEIPRDEPSAVFLDRGRSGAALLAADLKALPWRARLQRLRDLAFPPPAFMRASFPSAPRLALPWLYVYRGARGLGRLLHRVDRRGKSAGRLRRLFAAPAAERRVFVKAACYLATAKLVLAVGGFRVARRLARDASGGASAEHSERARLLARSVERASRNLPIRANCLDRSVALCWLLAAERLGGVMRIGVRPAGTAIDAHAWVERGEEHLLDDGAGHFATFEPPLAGGDR